MRQAIDIHTEAGIDPAGWTITWAVPPQVSPASTAS